MFPSLKTIIFINTKNRICGRHAFKLTYIYFKDCHVPVYIEHLCLIKDPKFSSTKSIILTLLTPTSDGYVPACVGTPGCCISDLNAIWQNQDLEI